ncbi:IS607 family transposase [Nonomuraea sp. CA-143628]|uniref:IS607 family transposase n=1 Tax=Nonomuraea sp. CA-143628 TaxID=3239997 RepID=UPI003D8EF3CF
MPVPARQAPSGTWLVDDAPAAARGRVVAYCRVSSAEQKPDLDRQTARVVEGANLLGLAVGEVVKEIGSGMNGRRRKLHRVLSDPKVEVIVVEHRDRLARFGVQHLETALSASGRRLVVLDRDENAARNLAALAADCTTGTGVAGDQGAPAPNPRGADQKTRTTTRHREAAGGRAGGAIPQQRKETRDRQQDTKPQRTGDIVTDLPGGNARTADT